MKKCYIAGKISDLEVSDYTTNFNVAKLEVKELGYEPISPLDLPHAHDKSWNNYMKEDLIAMLQCECVYVLRNWRHSDGAKIEVNTALSVGINIIHQP